MINSRKHRLEVGDYLEVNIGSLEDISVIKENVSIEDQKLFLKATVATLGEKYKRDGYILKGYDYFFNV